jgi:Leucine-rich repeat (LRR) protein
MPADGAVVDLSGLRTAPALAIVSIYKAAEFTNPSALREIPSLYHLSLTVNRPGVWRSISFLTEIQLNTLWLDNLQEVRDYEPLRAQTKMTSLWLDEATSMTNLDAIRHLKNLTSLSLSDGGVDDAATRVAEEFPKLEVLYLNGTRTGDIAALSGLPLRRLYIDRCPVTDLRPLAGKNVDLTLSRRTEYRGLDELGPGVRIEYR